MAIKSFKINISDAQIKDLHERLSKTIMPSEIAGAGWSYGPTVEYVKDMTDQLLHKYDWRKHEARINQYPQFITEIDEQNIHFLHITSLEEHATPLMLIHGWPGSIVEFLDVIDPLTNPVKYGGKAEDAFHLVIPSLPGFGFSGPTTEAGWTADRTAAAFNALMRELGYEHYGVQGGDAGAIVGPAMARLAPENVVGVHVNAATMGFIPMGEIAPADMEVFSDAEKARLARLQSFMAERFAFNMLQSTRPQSLAFAISDSPAGLLAWASELFTDYGDNVDMVDKEAFLTNFMIYWFTNTAASSIRMYYEGAHDPNAWTPKENSGVPTAVAVFEEGDIAIRKYGEQGNDIVRWTEYEKGSHYAVLEVPEVWTNDVQEFFHDLRSTK
jgi:pimeloyl-ACP methyl ester carboxylesterase